jgi:transcription termination factor Rho
MGVLRRRDLEDSPLADLHAIASELGLEGYRALRKRDLVTALLDAQGGEDEGNATEAGLAETDDGDSDVTEAGVVGEADIAAEADAPAGEPEEPEPPADEQAAEEEPEVVEEPKS